MGDIFTTRQKAERLAENSGVSLAVLFPCPQCGHANRPASQKVESIKLYLLDKLPPCRKCGFELKKRHFRQSTISTVLMKRARRELGLAPEIPSAELSLERQKQRIRIFISGEEGTHVEYK